MTEMATWLSWSDKFGGRLLMRHSVIRRSSYIMVFFITGHAFYYLLVLAANLKLDPAGFGRFYLGWVMLNILVAPGAVLTLSLTTYFAEINQSSGVDGVIAATRLVAKRLLPWAIAIVLVTELLLFFSGMAVGADSTVMIGLLPLTALSSIMVDTLRAAYQGMLRFVWFGVSWPLWCLAQFLFGAAGLGITGAPWAAFLGMFVANCLTLIFLLWSLWWARGRYSTRAEKTTIAATSITRSLRDMLPLCAALAVIVVLTNADVLIAYLKLSSVALGAYSASAVLPKAIVTATQPVVQVILPVATTIRNDVAKVREAMFKAVGMTFALAACGAFALWLLSEQACGGRFGIKFCQPDLLTTLALAAIAISVIRTTAIADVLAGRKWRPYIAIAALAAFVALNAFGQVSAAALASSYSLLCWLLLTVLVSIVYVTWRLTPTQARIRTTGKP
jgi:O-antigen/teichoic acid export membrane protein